MLLTINTPHDQCFKITSFYKDDLDPTELSTQLKMLSVHFAEQGSQVILQDCVNYLRIVCQLHSVPFIARFAFWCD